MRRVLYTISILGIVGVASCSTDNTSTNGSRSETERMDHADRGYTYSDSEDSRILNFLHEKNQEEIVIGQLAQATGSSEEARRYGSMLERDHSQNDAKVQSLASSVGVTLTNPQVVSPGHETNPNAPGSASTTPPKDPASDLRALSGQAFDLAFARKMKDGHHEVIQRVETSRQSVQNADVRAYLDETLTALHKHEQMADDLLRKTQAGSTDRR